MNALKYLKEVEICTPCVSAPSNRISLLVILFYKFSRPKNIVYSFIPLFWNTISSLFYCSSGAWRSYVSTRVRSKQLIRFPFRASFSLKRQWALISRFTDLRFLKFFFYCNIISCSLIELYGYKYHISEQIKLKF